MGQYKVSDLLYRTRSKAVKIIDKEINQAGASGICCSFRPSSSSSRAAKYSTVCTVLDLMLVDKCVEAMEGTDNIYTKFTYKDIVYECVYSYQEDDLKWISSEPEGAGLLVPIVAYAISSNNTGDEAEELKTYFKEICEAKTQEEKEQSVLLFCDAFYYSIGKDLRISSFPKDLNRIVIDRGKTSGYFTTIEALKNYSAAPSAVTEAPLEEEKEEDYKIEYSDWSEEQKGKVPPESILDTFVMTPVAEVIAKKVKYRMTNVIKKMEAGQTGVNAIGKDCVNLLLVGRPGTGKTTIINAIAAMTGMPIYTVPISKHTEESFAEGINKIVEGKISFVETELLKAFEHGGIIVCEEINLADPGVIMGSLGQALEYPYVIMKDGYKPVYRHPLCIIIGTMNTGTAGSRQLNEALSSRFKNTYILDDPDKKDFLKILSSKGYTMKNCRYVYQKYEQIMNYLKDPKNGGHEDLCGNITIRSCFGALESIEEGVNQEDAIISSIVGKIGERDLEVARELISLVKQN